MGVLDQWRAIQKYKVLVSRMNGKKDVDSFIAAFAEFKGIGKDDFPAFKERILDGMGKMGLNKKQIDLEAYQKIAKEVEHGTSKEG